MFLKVLLLAIFIMTNAIASTPAEGQMPIIVSVKWLKQHIDDKDIVIIDVRKEQEYKKGHIKGAVNMPVMKDFFTKDTLRVPRLSSLKTLFDNAGIAQNTKVIVYDGGAFCWSARAVWVLKLLGHKDESLLEYGYGKYIQTNLPISKKIPKRKKADFIPRINNNMIATKLDVMMAIKRGELILDGRTKDMYMGKTSIAKRSGHIPTAKLFSGSNNYEVTKEGHKLKSLDSLKKIYQKFPKNKKSIIYCQDGADAALDNLLMQKLGHNSVVYEGSWAEWGNDFSLPIVDPSAKSSK